MLVEHRAELTAIIIFLAYRIEFMANKGRDRVTGSRAPRRATWGNGGVPSGAQRGTLSSFSPRSIPRLRASIRVVGAGALQSCQLAVVAIDMRAIDIWVHISLGWQSRELSPSVCYLDRFSLVSARPLSLRLAAVSAPLGARIGYQYASVNYARPLLRSLTRL